MEKLKKVARRMEVMGIVLITLNVVLALFNLIAGNYNLAVNQLIIAGLMVFILSLVRDDIRDWDLIERQSNLIEKQQEFIKKLTKK